jgi:acyl-CoA synthetase (AMP-forming)/AMP-acid ligase II
VTDSSCSNLSDLLSDLARRHGDRLAVASPQSELTFAGLDRDAGRWTADLRAAGCSRGTKVGLLAPNSPAWLAAAFGVWRSGATLVPISTFVTPRELGEVLNHADIEVLLTARRLNRKDFVAALGDVDAPRLRRTIVLDEHEPSAVPATADAVQPESLACILYTSGTTGRPKGVCLSHRAILATTLPTAERSGLTDADSLLSTLPLFWVAGLVIRALPTLAAGCALLFVDTYTPEAVLEVLERRHPTALHLRPPQVADLLAHPKFKPGFLSAIRRGNGRTEWFNGLLPADARFITGYGMTEMAGYVTALDWRDSDEARSAQMGTPLPGVEMRVVDDRGGACRAGENGAIRVRGPGLFSGYHKEPAGTGFDVDGWFVTGDLGAIDAGGTFHFAGRTKDLLRVKGINVSPIEVEQILGAHPGVQAAYVVGLPADGLEQKVVALIVTADDEVGNLREALKEIAAEQLSHYKRPDAYLFLKLDEVPFGPTSKPQKDRLAAIAAERLGR